ncbi:glutamine synthetase family protein [Pseudomonas aeruginosa]|uniref:glutamine synthetase family protein n=1 Tax=Pseudomonas aeruginosa TaxID=287 RepID=UPI00105334B9|nr:glutamine synthetase family protein [Pseudomonas aeruginosa]
MNFACEQEAQDFLAANPDIELFELFILDANGVPRGKLLHRDELLAVYRSGRPLPSTILGLTMNGEDVEDSGLVWDVGDIDCRAYPLSGSLVRLPWRQIPTAAVQVSMHPSEGLPASIADPRHLLVRTIDALKSDGYHPVMAAELEFYLLDRERDANGRPQPARDADGGRPRATQVYGLRELEQIEPFLADLYAACKAQGLPARGMLASLLDSLLLFCPNANSYRRFQANSYAPLAQTWGVDNRTVSLRVPGGPASSRHIEHRICGADANPYLAAAALLAGVHRGIREGIDPGTPVEGNGYAQAGKRLPTDWLTALDALQGSEWAREAFGEPFLGVYLAVKRAEYRQFMGEVGEQDWRWYLTQA